MKKNYIVQIMNVTEDPGMWWDEKACTTQEQADRYIERLKAQDAMTNAVSDYPVEWKYRVVRAA